MSKRFICVVVLLGFVGATSAVIAGNQPTKIVIDKCKKKKSGVAFDHTQHSKKLKIACKSCHHKGKNKSCFSCHKGKAKGKVLGCAEMSMKKNPYHVKCAGCHKKMKKGPRKCKQCHK